jgi:hypothetical protein
MGTQPENTHGIQTQTQPNPYPNFGLGSGITLGPWVPEFWVPNPRHNWYRMRTSQNTYLLSWQLRYMRKIINH